MKILILTQKIDLNDDVLGFMHGWVEEFSRQAEKITVICLEKGRAELPGNVKVFSLGKENGRSKVKYLINFYKYIWAERKNYNAVFAHMNQIYVILGFLFWRLWGKKIGLWYAHRATPWSLKLAEKFADLVFTSTKSGFRLPSKKVKVIGQGIDIDKFKPAGTASGQAAEKKIISIGRISPSKDYETLIRAVEIIKNQGVNIRAQIIGGPATEADKDYFLSLKKQIAEKSLTGMIEFTGPVANKDIVSYLNGALIFVNMGLTGSLDKAMVEAMASGLPVLTCNEALLEVFGEYKNVLMYGQGDERTLAEKIVWLINLPAEELSKIGGDLRQIAVRDHSLRRFVGRILSLYEQKN